jgi:peptidylamidoglycolate lyase
VGNPFRLALAPEDVELIARAAVTKVFHPSERWRSTIACRVEWPGREVLMKRRAVGSLFPLLALASGGLVVPGRGASLSSSYEVVHGWPQLPDGFTFGEVSSVAVDSHNHVFVVHHGSDGKNQDRPVMCFEGATGKFVGSWGEGLSGHGLAIDNQNNLWIVSAKQHQVYKFTHNGERLMTLGTRDIPGQDGQHFNKPTAIAVARDGEFYVTDGYGNSRVAKFSAKGEFVREWGRKGAGPGEFDVPHGIGLDRAGRVYVADRGNHRIQVFDSTGRYLESWSDPALGLPWALAVSRDGFVFVTDGGETNKDKPLHASILKLDPQGKILERFGRLGQYDGQFYWPHGIAVGENGDVYVTDVHVGRRVQKFIRR